MRPFAAVLLIILVLGFVVGGQANSPQETDKIPVAVSFCILEDFVRQVGGDRVEATSLIPLEADAHAWEPTPKEARLIADAQLVLANGGGLEPWLDGLFKNAARPGTPLIIVSDGLEMIDSGPGGHGADPHFWLSIPNAIHYVQVITEALVQISPADAPYFQERSAAYISQLRQLDQKFQSELANIPPENRVIITFHNAFSYLAEQYGFSTVDFLVHNPEGEPSVRDMGRLTRILAGQNQPVIFGEPQFSAGNRYVQTLALETGAAVRTLYSGSFDSKITTYLQMMEYNLKTLGEALQ